METWQWIILWALAVVLVIVLRQPTEPPSLLTEDEEAEYDYLSESLYWRGLHRDEQDKLDELSTKRNGKDA